MKKILIIVLMAMSSFFAFAQLDPFMPINPVTYAQGGAFTANAEGINAFFFNPAGFSHDKGELTVASVGVYSEMNSELLKFISEALDLGLDLNKKSRQGIAGGGIAGAPSLSDAGLGTEFEGLVTSFAGVGDFLGAVAVQGGPDGMEDVMEAALDAIVNMPGADPAYSEAIKNINPDELTEEELMVLVMESPILEDGNVVSILEAMEDATGNQIKMEDHLGAGWEEAINDGIKEVKDTMPGGEMRVGALGSVGYSGQGFGVGLFMNVDASFKGDTIFDSKGRAMASITLAGGFAIPLGPIKLGFLARPTLLGYTNIYPAQTLLSHVKGGDSTNLATLFSDGVYSGLYAGLDAGVLWDIGPLTLGLAVKDIIPLPVVWHSVESFEAYTKALETNSTLINGDKAKNQGELYKVPPMKINIGLQFHPDLGKVSRFVDPRVNVDFHDVLGFFRYIEKDPLGKNKATLGNGYNILERLRLGADLAFFEGLFSVRAGFYGDMLTIGSGIHLFFLDVNVGVGFSDLRKNEAGKTIFQKVGLAFDVALRFN